jgi:hypothetical protein
MNHIYISTNGDGVSQRYSRISTHPSLKIQMGDLHLLIGDIEVQIKFDTAAEMIQFCEQHNFTYKDDRTGVQKYFDDLEDTKNANDKMYCAVCQGLDTDCDYCNDAFLPQ